MLNHLRIGLIDKIFQARYFFGEKWKREKGKEEKAGRGRG